MNDYFKRVSALTATRFWINNVTLAEADKALEAGAIGCTQNPTYTWKILNGSEDEAIAKSALKRIMAEEKDDETALHKLQLEPVCGVAKKFMPLYEATHGKNGYVSIQSSPLNEDPDTIIRCARMHAKAAPNIMAKIPATENGLKAIEVLIRERVPINATECMATRQVLDVCELYTKVTKDMKDPAPMYFSLITGIYDEYLQKYVKANNIDIRPDVLWQAGLSVAKKVYYLVKERKYNVGLIGGGARGLHHFTEMVGADANITINWKGTADKLIELDGPAVCHFFASTPFSVEDELLDKLPEHRRAYFINGIEPSEYEDYGPVELFRSNFISAWKKSLEYIASCR
jgi:transaldolase